MVDGTLRGAVVAEIGAAAALGIALVDGGTVEVLVLLVSLGELSGRGSMSTVTGQRSVALIRLATLPPSASASTRSATTRREAHFGCKCRCTDESAGIARCHFDLGNRQRLKHWDLGDG